VNSAVEARWRDLAPLLDLLLELPASARASWMEVQVEDPELRQLLEVLLAKDDAHGMLDRPGSDYSRILIEPPPAPTLIGREACPYRLLQLIGEGGMASVFLAERADGAFSQQVAVKVMRVGMLDPYERERFSREQQILARLEHPHIARLLDGGLTPEGVPWIALEYVPGEPITRYCDARKRDIRARLRLFMQVCEAVQFAHQALIVHRDLKPNNILVREDETPKLLDFGIAKLLDDDPERVDATRTEYRRLTPGYAAPEQFTSAPVTTATDVYTLGVLLHELLIGRKPIARGDDTLRLPSSMFAAEADAPMRAGARASTPRALRRALAGDLDCILLKALRSEPSRRYASAAALSEDVGRHLDGEPIHARPDAWTYRAGKFVQRHMWSIAAATVFLVVLLASTAFSLLEAQAARAASQLADREAKDAAAENDFLISTFESVNPFNTQGTKISARALLESTASRIDDEFSDSPRISAKLHDAMGEVFFSFKRITQARRQYEAAVEADTRFLPADGPDILDAQTTVQVQRLYQGDIAGAIPELIRIERSSADRGGDYLKVHYRARENLALAMTLSGDYARATQISEGLLPEAGILASRGVRTYAKYNLASDYLQQERLADATRATDELSANDLRTDGSPSPGLIFHLRAIAELLLELGRMQEAQMLFARLQAVALAQPDLQSWFFAEDLAHEAIALHALDDRAQSQAKFRAAFDSFREAGDEFPQVLVDAEYGVARALIADRAFDEADRHLESVLVMYRPMGFPDHPLILACREAQAEINLARGDASAATELQTLLDKQRPAFGRELPATLLVLARDALNRSDMAHSQALLDEMARLLDRQGRPRHPFAYQAQMLRAELEDARKNGVAARNARLQALASAMIAFGRDHARTRDLLTELGAKDKLAATELLREAATLSGPPPAEELYQRALHMLARVEAPAANTSGQ
jgi:serine/threonine-protein kinase